MKRFHVHVAVEDLNASLAFYSKLFGSEPSVQKIDYAKWMLDEAMLTEADTVCCYARSDKRWVTDPQGVAWETFHTQGTSDTYSASAATAACCTPNQSLAHV